MKLFLCWFILSTSGAMMAQTPGKIDQREFRSPANKPKPKDEIKITGPVVKPELKDKYNLPVNLPIAYKYKEEEVIAGKDFQKCKVTNVIAGPAKGLTQPFIKKGQTITFNNFHIYIVNSENANTGYKEVDKGNWAYAEHENNLAKVLYIKGIAHLFIENSENKITLIQEH